MALFVLIPLLPLCASVILVLGGRRWGEYGHRIGIPAIWLSFGLSVLAFLEVLNNGPFSLSLYRLFQSGSLVVDLNLFVDQLTVLLLLLVTGVSGIVHVYSSRYMIGDPRYNRFSAVIALFTFSMVLLVMSGNLLMLLISWEVMGLCSYLLIAHWSERPAACAAATKAFLVNAVADVGFTFGIILTFVTFGTLDIQTILAQADGMKDHTINVMGWLGWNLEIKPVTLIPLLFLIGAMGKSAQIPFHVWLPYAMEAPTPVSALIHAATMVNAGPFLLVRLSPLIMLSPIAMTAMAIIGAATAVFAGVVSLTQSDIKKILAYSTISQIGFMIMACGLGAFVVAIFHLLAHGCYKAFFFLSTGNALQSVQAARGQGETHPTSRDMGPLYGGAFLLACLPPFILFSGSYASLWGVTGFASATIGFWIIGLATVFVTSIYLFRSVTSLFVHVPRTYWTTSGQPALERRSIHPRFADGSILGGLVLATILLGGTLTLFWRWFAGFLAPAVIPAGVALGGGGADVDSLIWIPVALGVALAGWAVAFSRHLRSRRGEPGRKKTWLYVLFWNKWYFDEIYDAYLVNPTIQLARWLWQVIDVRVIDRTFHSVASYAVLFSRWLWRIVDLKGIDRIVVDIGQRGVGLTRWLWQVVGVGWLERKTDQAGSRTEVAGPFLEEAESHTIQHQLLVMILWLVLATGTLYLLV